LNLCVVFVDSVEKIFRITWSSI